jgi:sugar (pentulose or hexulose) kinase
MYKNACIDPSMIKAIGISAQGETMLFLDEEGKSLRNAIVWMDTRAEDEALSLKKQFTDEVCYKKTGQVSFEACWPASKILWIKKHEPELFHKVRKYMLIEDYFIYRLTGKFVSEGSLLCSTTYWDITTKKYWSEMLEFIGIREDQLPQIMEPGEKVGTILPAIASELGLSSNTIVCTGALDQAAGAIGVGNITEGIFSENIGAALAICVPLNSPRFDSNMKMPLHYFGLPDTYMMHTFTTGGMTIRWYRDTFGEMEKAVSQATGKSAYDYLSKEAALVSAGSEGLITLPHFNGSMAPDVNSKAKGVFYGVTLKHSKAHFVRSIMESVGYIIKRNIEELSKMGIEVNEIRALGGGSRDETWNQIISDITGKKVISMKCSEAACLGAAIIAGKAIGMYPSVEEACRKMISPAKIYEPNASNADVYGNGFQDYKQLFLDLLPMFNRQVIS